MDQLSTGQRKDIADAVWEENDENQAKQILESWLNSLT
jgi:Fe2+ or Zn2+ uptake regulation protein